MKWKVQNTNWKLQKPKQKEQNKKWKEQNAKWKQVQNRSYKKSGSDCPSCLPFL